MRGMFLRILAIPIIAVVFIGIVSGCTQEGKDVIKSQSTTMGTDCVNNITKDINGLDISKNVEIIFWMVGDAPRDLAVISEELNKMSKRDLNCTISINMTTWSDYMQRYNLLLSSGQPIDLLFTAEWLNYNQFAKKGAFKELDTLLPQYAPELYQFVPENYWEAVKVNDRIYTIPATWREYVNVGIAYREDLRKKYDLPEPNSLENIEAYLEGVKINEPSLTLTSEQASDNGFGPFFTATEVLNIKYRWIDFNMPYGLIGDYDNPSELKSYWGSPEFAEDMKMFQRWASKGFWSRNALVNKDPIHTLFSHGKTVAILSGENPTKYNNAYMKIEALYPDWEIGYYPYARTTGLVKPVHPIHNGFAIPKSSENPERALLFYEKLVLDKEYNYLTQYGIEGRHYTIEEGKYYKMIGDTRTNGFQREGLNGWAWRNPKIQLFDKSFNKVLELFKEFDSYAVPEIFFGFVEDYTPYQAERAALFQVQSQYLIPLQAGFVDDVDEAIAVFMEKAKAAGLEKIQEEYIKQWKKYCDEQGLE